MQQCIHPIEPTYRNRMRSKFRHTTVKIKSQEKYPKPLPIRKKKKRQKTTRNEQRPKIINKKTYLFQKFEPNASTSQPIQTKTTSGFRSKHKKTQKIKIIKLWAAKQGIEKRFVSYHELRNLRKVAGAMEIEETSVALLVSDADHQCSLFCLSASKSQKFDVFLRARFWGFMLCVCVCVCVLYGNKILAFVLVVSLPIRDPSRTRHLN